MNIISEKWNRVIGWGFLFPNRERNQIFLIYDFVIGLVFCEIIKIISLENMKNTEF